MTGNSCGRGARVGEARLPLLVVLALALSLWTAPGARAEGIDVIAVDDLLSENWRDPGVVAFRRAGTTGSLTVRFALSGTAVSGVDYAVNPGNAIVIPDGEREVTLSFAPLQDAVVERPETMVVTLQADPGYSLPAEAKRRAVTLTLSDSGTKPGAKEAARFLFQAAFGPSADSISDRDMVPENVESVMSLGFARWIDGQFRTKPGLHTPTLDAMVRARKPVSWDSKVRPWWERAIGPSAIDPLRQRVAFALSEIFVVSDRLDDLSNQPQGMTSYYDMLVTGAFGNFRGLLRGVALHPCMGTYLSHLKNRKADPEAGTFPDENFAREVMQLFSIGLWELNPDGTRVLSGGQPVPAYDNNTITAFARVFTGLSFGGKRGTEFWWPPENYTAPMRMWDEYHDMAPKVLLNGVVLPARPAFDPASPDRGVSGMLDVEAAIDCLFHHPNTGPFIGRQLIQRLVTSNPSPDYISRVAQAFANNGSGVRGDMKAVIKAILLDPEARLETNLSSSTYGKMKEPYLRTVNLARAFNARSANGSWPLAYLDEIHFQQPYSSPSVFNFFRPGYVPAGPLSDAGLVAPEFQILHSISAVSVPNYHFNALRQGFNRWGDANWRNLVLPGLRVEMSLVNDVPALMRRLDLVLTGGTLDPEQHRIIREFVESIDNTVWEWKKERVWNAIYLICTLPEYAVQR
ncbi:MAG: DUF1800 family protein [Verrucomicrobia bacterium]|nr:DUF1800 family protein [Verrucomicrobiota bacterium]